VIGSGLPGRMEQPVRETVRKETAWHCKLLILWPAWTRTRNQTVMTGRISIGFVDFAVFSFGLHPVRYILAQSFLMRNWCGNRVEQH